MLDGIDVTNPDAITASVQAAQDAAKAEKARIEAERIAKLTEENKDRLEKWLAGENVSARFYYLKTAYMRIVGDVIETTEGARVPLADVQASKNLIIRAMRGAIAKGEAFVPPADNRVRFGHYGLSRIEDNGVVVVGCHRFAPEEIERIAAAI